ncbi:MAG: RNA polymerase sigma factor, partial [Candidatus Dormibacteraeota bacterium]|nr:RNA polymerase sigma factor [Candidatus Dormibacteraeota bacterium]
MLDALDERSAPLHDLVDLYRLHEAALRRMAMLYLRSEADAEDAVQETFARVAGRLETLNGEARSYLRAVLRRVCCDELRRRARVVPVDQVAPGDGGDTADAGTISTQRQELARAWAALSPRERRLAQKLFAGYSYAEIASTLEMTPGALNVAFSRLRRRARAGAAAVGAGLVALVGALRTMTRRSSSAASSAGFGSAALAVAATVAIVEFGLPSIHQRAAVLTLPPGTHAATARSSGYGQAGVPPTNNAAGGASIGHGRGSHAPGSGGPAVSNAVHGLVDPGQGAQQQDVVFTSITPSPNYGSDHTAYASGSLANGCGRPTCPVLFRTTDGGSTWSSLQATGFLGGPVLLAPSFPEDPSLFVAGPAGLQRSDDRGATFTTVVPAPAAPAAIDPASPPGDARVLVAAQAPLVYDAASRTLSQGPQLPANVTLPNAVAYGPSGTALVAATQPDPTANGQQDAVIVRCSDGACSVVQSISGQPGLNLAVSPTSGSDATVFAWSAGVMAVSRDGGATFSALPDPDGISVTTVGFSPGFAGDGRVTMGGENSGTASPALLASSDAAHTFAAVSAQGLQGAVASLVILP